MSLSSGSIKRPVAVTMLFLAIALLGVISFERLPIDLLPDISYPRLVVYTSYPDVLRAKLSASSRSRSSSVSARWWE